MSTTTVPIDPITRIEGHARVEIDIDDDGVVQDARFMVRELRGFERILVGMAVERLPHITARICGVCPTAHHLASARTVDKVFSVEIPPAAGLLRELMYMGHFIHSHALSLFVLSGPDLVLGLDADPARRNVLGILDANPEVAQAALRLRTLGQKINENVGGRGVHPVTAVAGGIALDFTDSLHKKLREQARECLEITLSVKDMVFGLVEAFIEQYPQVIDAFASQTYYLGTVKNGALDFYEGTLRVMAPDGTIAAEFEAPQYTEHLTEGVHEHSYMKPVYFLAGKKAEVHRVGTLARINIADEVPTPEAGRMFEDFRSRFGRPAHATVLFHVARLIELVYSCERAIEILEDSQITGPRRAEVTATPRDAISHVEAPRGTLIHDYQVDDQAVVTRANLIVATQQNSAAIHQAIRQGATLFLKKDDLSLLNGVEFCIRSYDPCLSCATHMVGQMPLDVTVLQGGQVVRRARR